MCVEYYYNVSTWLGWTTFPRIHFLLLFLIRGGHKEDSWEIWKPQPFLTKSTHCCCSADSPHWCEAAAKPAIALSPQDHPSAARTAGPGVCVYLCDNGPQHMQDTHVTKIRSNKTRLKPPVGLHPTQAYRFQPALDLSHLASIFLSWLPVLWILSSGVRSGNSLMGTA